jgi:hypothetical protein
VVVVVLAVMVVVRLGLVVEVAVVVGLREKRRAPLP